MTSSATSRRWHALLGCAVLANLSNCLLPSCASAQLLDRYFPSNVPAYENWAASASGPPVDLGFSPLGIRLGDFLIYPQLAEAAGYATNPYGTVGGAGHASALEQTNATITASSDWSRNNLSAYLNVSDTRYLDLGQSTTNWTASFGSTIDVLQGTLDIGYAHIHAVTLPTSLGAFAQLNPVSNDDDDVKASYLFGTGRISLEPSLQADIYRFGSVGQDAGFQKQDLFNRDALTGSLTANYQFAGGHNLLMILSDSVVDYQGAAAQRPANYTDLSVLFGIEYRASAVIAYRALVGYEDRNPTNRGVTDETLDAPAAELDVLWKPTALTSVTGKVSQSFENAPTDGGQGISETSVQILLDHSLSRAFEIEGSARYIRGAFPDSGGTEQGVAATMRGDWHLSRHIVLSAEYDFSEESGGNQSTQSYRNNQILLEARLQW